MDENFEIMFTLNHPSLPQKARLGSLWDVERDKKAV